MKVFAVLLCMLVIAIGGGVVGAYIQATGVVHKYLGISSVVDTHSFVSANNSVKKNALGLENDADAKKASASSAIAPSRGVIGFASAVQRAESSVVSIYTSDANARQQSMNFFAQPNPLSSGVGSGVVIDGKGHIITNYHVIKDATQIFIGAPRKRSFVANIVGIDEETDLALLQADLPRPMPIRISDSDTLQNGDIVLAIGNPFGVGRTVTMGIVSALGRDNVGINTYERFIQTDTAINPGNSGGALVNTNGELIGINTAIVSNSGNYQGIAFAVPSNQVKRIIDSLRDHGEIIRGWLGVSIHTAFLEEYDREFAEVIGVFSDGPAQQAGIAPGDLLLSINDKDIANGPAAKMHIASIEPGATLRMRINRQGEEIMVMAISSRRPSLVQ